MNVPSQTGAGGPSQAKPPNRRSALYAGVAAVAALGGAGLAWWKFQPHALTVADTVLWGMSFDTPEGGKLTMQSLRGKPLLVNFWATWCPPCVDEMPLLDKFHRENASNGWQVLGLAIDQPGPVKRFLQRTPVSYPVGIAGLDGTTLVRTLGDAAGGLPFSVVFNQAGLVVHRKIGKLAPQDLSRWTARS